jgi:hypothetical protein
MTPQIDVEHEAQDRAEILDETHLTEDGGRIANFDEIADVYDATRAEGDGDDDAFGGVADDDVEDAHPEEAVDPAADPHVDNQLDKGLKETFPASDPVSINPGAD